MNKTEKLQNEALRNHNLVYPLSSVLNCSSRENASISFISSGEKHGGVQVTCPDILSFVLT